jgi:hypothetical protein
MLVLLLILVLAFVQNISFSLVSRARNRDNMWYHATAAVLSNGVWFLTFNRLIEMGMSFSLFIPYCAGTVAGSLTGARISIWIEKAIGARADAPRPAPITREEFEELTARVATVEDLDVDLL